MTLTAILNKLTHILQPSAEGRKTVGTDLGVGLQLSEYQELIDFVENSGVTSEKAKKRKEKRKQHIRLYSNADADFQPGEEVSGVISGFLCTKNKHLQYVFVDFPDGRHTRVHKRSFDISGSGRMNPQTLRRGDTITLRKVGYLPDRHNTCWVIESCSLSGLLTGTHGDRTRESQSNSRDLSHELLSHE